MFPFAFFDVLWLHQKLLLQPLKYFYSVVSFLLSLYYFSVARSLQTVFAFFHHKIIAFNKGECILRMSLLTDLGLIQSLNASTLCDRNALVTNVDQRSLRRWCSVGCFQRCCIKISLDIFVTKPIGCAVIYF